MFQRLGDRATTTALEALALYVEENWITSTMWPQSCWSVFMLPIRTNNDIEARHHSLNSRANNRVHLPFYLLVELLPQEARLVSIQIRLVSRIQRKKYRLLQSKIFKTLTATRFLPAASSNSTVTWTARRPEPEAEPGTSKNGSRTRL